MQVNGNDCIRFAGEWHGISLFWGREQRFDRSDGANNCRSFVGLLASQRRQELADLRFARTEELSESGVYLRVFEKMGQARNGAVPGVCANAA